LVSTTNPSFVSRMDPDRWQSPASTGPSPRSEPTCCRVGTRRRGRLSGRPWTAPDGGSAAAAQGCKDAHRRRSSLPDTLAERGCIFLGTRRRAPESSRSVAMRLVPWWARPADRQRPRHRGGDVGGSGGQARPRGGGLPAASRAEIDASPREVHLVSTQSWVTGPRTGRPPRVRPSAQESKPNAVRAEAWTRRRSCSWSQSFSSTTRWRVTRRRLPVAAPGCSLRRSVLDRAVPMPVDGRG
jgi:hypothetical protein